MIARIHFTGTVVNKEKDTELTMKDYTDLHVAALQDAEEIFKYWLQKDYSIRGHNGVWHMQGKYGKIEFVKVEKKPKE